MGQVAGNPNIDSNSNGFVASDTLLELLVTGNEAFQKGSFHIIERVDDKVELPRLSIDENIIQDREAMPSSSVGTLSRTGRVIEPLDMMVYYEFNPRNFEKDWMPFVPSGKFPDKVTNPRVQRAIMSVTKKSIDNQIGRLIWQGDTSLPSNDPLHYFDGYITVLNADPDTITVPSIGLITSANILQVLNNVYDAIPDAVLNTNEVVLNVSTGTFRAYEKALEALDTKGQDPTQSGKKLFRGLEIRDYSGFPDNTILACVTNMSYGSTNLYAGVDMKNDSDSLKMERLRPEGELFFVKALFKMAVNAAWTQESVLYQGV